MANNEIEFFKTGFPNVILDASKWIDKSMQLLFPEPLHFPTAGWYYRDCSKSLVKVIGPFSTRERAEEASKNNKE